MEHALESQPCRTRRLPLGWLLLPVLGALLWAPVVQSLHQLWSSDKALSHGPLIPLIAAGHLWTRRAKLRRWNDASRGGLALLALAGLAHVAATWTDIAFLKPLSLIGMVAGGIWFLGGLPALRSSIGALGFLVFMIPWPTTLVAGIAFPLQLTSSAYAALLGGILGLPIHRDGVHLAVLPDPEKAPVYSILVAQQCSGLTSLTVLLALAYLIAYHTPVGLGWRALLLASVVPLAILMNAVRLTLILYAGTHHSAELAQWVHDNEAPVLIFFSSASLLGIRSALLSWLASRPDNGPRSQSGGSIDATVPVPHS